MKKRKIIGLSVMLLVLLVQASLAFGWGTDIPIWKGGKVNVFDVDYAMDGTMYVGFQVEGESIIRVYRSTDHGTTWSQWTTLATNDADYATSPRNNLSRIRLLYDELFKHLFVFYVDSDGYLSRWVVKTDLSEVDNRRVSKNPVLEGSFDVTWDNSDPNKSRARKIYVYWSEGNTVSPEVLKYTTSIHPIESDWSLIKKVEWWPCPAKTRGSLVFGPPNTVFAAKSYNIYQYSDYSCLDNSRIQFMSIDSTMDPLYNQFSSDAKVYDPRVAAANVDYSGVWLMYNRDGGGHEIDLHYRYSPDGGLSWDAQEYTVSSVNGVDEYISDIKFYKDYPNSYINMVYIYDDPEGMPQRKVIWAWTSTGDPTTWNGNITVNDEDVTSWPEDVAPRIIYSPGASASGGGVVFSYSGRDGLYFDAPWISAIPAIYTLTITVNGSGRVESSPPGIDYCTNNTIVSTQTCSYSFDSGTDIVLNAAPIDGTDYTSSFIKWSGDCSGDGVCALSMDSDKTVYADFGALGIPVFTVPVPDSQDDYEYPPTEFPETDPDPSNMKPMGVGDVAGGTLNLKVEFPKFTSPVDIYLGIYAPAIDPEVHVILSDNSFQKASEGLVPWRSDVSEAIPVSSLYGDVDISGLPSGTYTFFVAVAPSGVTTDFYIWSTIVTF